MSEGPAPNRGGWRRDRARERAIGRAWLTFVAVLGALTLLEHALSPWINTTASAWTARMTAWTLRRLGAAARAQGTIVVSSVYRLEVVGECTAVFPIAIFAAAVAAYPSRLVAKLTALEIGVPLIVAVNLVRLVSLCYIGRSYPASFEFAHAVVWQSLIVFLPVLLWLVWVARLPAAPDESVRA